MINYFCATLGFIGDGLYTFSVFAFECITPIVPVREREEGAREGVLSGRKCKELAFGIFGTVSLVIAVALAIFGVLLLTQTLGVGSLAYFWGASCLVGAAFSLLLAAVGLCGDHRAAPSSSDESESSSESSSSSESEEYDDNEAFFAHLRREEAG